MERSVKFLHEFGVFWLKCLRSYALRLTKVSPLPTIQKTFFTNEIIKFSIKFSKVLESSA